MPGRFDGPAMDLANMRAHGVSVLTVRSPSRDAGVSPATRRRATDPLTSQTKRRAPAMAGKGVSGPRPIAAKLMGVDRRQIGLQHVTQVS